MANRDKVIERLKADGGGKPDPRIIEFCTELEEFMESAFKRGWKAALANYGIEEGADHEEA